MRTIDLARELGVSSDWIRRLERLKKIPPAPRDLNGHRRYTHDDLAKIRQLLFRRGQPQPTVPSSSPAPGLPTAPVKWGLQNEGQASHRGMAPGSRR